MLYDMIVFSLGTLPQFQITGLEKQYIRTRILKQAIGVSKPVHLISQ